MATKNEFQMLKPFLTVLLTGLLFALCLTACTLPVLQQGVPIGAVGDSVTEGVTIIYPAEGAQLQVGEFVDVYSQIADPAGVTVANLIVNNEILRRDQLVSPVVSGDLYQPWLPSAPGTYMLQVILEIGAGSQSFSNQVTVYVGDLPSEEIVEAPVEVITSVTPTHTNPPGDTYTPTHTYTPETPTNTPRPEKAMASSDKTVNCRSGPDTIYPVQGSLKQGETVPIVGQNHAGTWLVVELQNPTRQCYVLGSLVNVSGDMDALLVFPDPPRPTFTFTIPPSDTPRPPTDTPKPPKPPTDTPFPVSPYNACHDYPDLSTCLADPNGFGGCSWDTGMNKCLP